MTLACFIALHVAPTVPFATIVWSALITIALGWGNALDWYVVYLISLFIDTVLDVSCLLLSSSVFFRRLTVVYMSSEITGTSLCLFLRQLFSASMCSPCQHCTSRF